MTDRATERAEAARLALQAVELGKGGPGRAQHGWVRARIRGGVRSKMEPLSSTRLSPSIPTWQRADC
jgi:hypothetical protein